MMLKVAERRAEREKRRLERERRRKEKEKRRKEKEKVRQAKLKIKTELMIKVSHSQQKRLTDFSRVQFHRKPWNWKKKKTRNCSATNKQLSGLLRPYWSVI